MDTDIINNLTTLVLIPAALFFAQSIIRATANRYQIIRTIYLDIANRTQSSMIVYRRLYRWNEDLQNQKNKNKAKLITLPKAQSERHYFLANSQIEIAKALWGEEEKRVRDAYRSLQIIEDIVNYINDCVVRYNKLHHEYSVRDIDNDHLKQYYHNILQDLGYKLQRYKYHLACLVGENTITRIKHEINDTEYDFIELSEQYSSRFFIHSALAYGLYFFVPMTIVILVIIFSIQGTIENDSDTYNINWLAYIILVLLIVESIGFFLTFIWNKIGMSDRYKDVHLKIRGQKIIMERGHGQTPQDTADKNP